MRLPSDQHDAITEMINTGVDRAVASLSDMLGQEITFCQPAIKIYPLDSFVKEVQEDSSVDICVAQEFSGGLSGRAILSLPQKCGVELGRVLGEVDEPLDELTADLVEILEEVGNIVLNGVLGTIGNMTGSSLEYSVPHLAQRNEVLRGFHVESNSNDEPIQQCGEAAVLLSDSKFVVSDSSMNGSFILLFDFSALQPHLQGSLVDACC